MTVFIVLDEHWDSTNIPGVYASAEAAMRDHPAPKGCEWERNAEPDTWWLRGLPYGQSLSILSYRVQS